MTDTDITALIERLREAARYYDDPVDENIIKEAADALEALQAERDQARRAALEEAAQVADKHWNGKNAIGEAIRALAGDRPQAGRIQQGREAQFQNSLLRKKSDD